jgi:hypothetical protein
MYLAFLPLIIVTKNKIPFYFSGKAIEEGRTFISVEIKGV